MQKILFILFITSQLFAQTSNANTEKNEKIIRSIFDESLSNGTSHNNLKYLCKNIGHRLSGSLGADKASKWTLEILKKMKVDTAYLQEVMVPHWVRGIEKSNIIGGQELTICALGGSVGTPKPIVANVIEVKTLEELKSLGPDKLKGKIVFFNRPMDPNFINTFNAYSGCVDQRSSGASEASKQGALGVIVRSMTLSLDDFPHTGATNYADSVFKIPAAAISTIDANSLSEQLKKNPKLQVSLHLTCKTLPDTLGYNVIAEIKGTEYPEEIIVVGGHLDSWDKGEGAHDDGAGCIQSMEVMKNFMALGIKPKRTIRCVLFMNEENGMKGGLKYEEIAAKKGEKHIAAIESDRGGLTPRGFSIEGGTEKEDIVKKWYNLFEKYDLQKIKGGYGGVDISPLRKHGTLLIGFEPDSQRYFDFHHADTDVFENVNKRELELGSASMTALVYLLSEYGLK